MDSAIVGARFDSEALRRLADALAAAVLVSLPWSTSATGILVACWLVILLPTLNVAMVRRELLSAAGGLPVALWFLSLCGMLWADVSLAERLDGLEAFHKLLMIPLLLAQFRRSSNGHWVIMGFFISCTVLLMVSYANALVSPKIHWGVAKEPGVPVKDYISQSGAFELCLFGAGHCALKAWRSGRRLLSLALTSLGVLFVINIAYIVTGRTALAVMPVLLVLFGLRQFGSKGTLAMTVGFAMLAAIVWLSSPYLRGRVAGVPKEIELYQAQDIRTPSGERLEFWRKSAMFVAQAPLLGHGTGSIHQQFIRVATPGAGTSSLASANPHQQILAVGVQLGMVGICLLIALWVAHLRLFVGAPGLAGWCGLSVVIQNIIASFFNSHLFDFTQGWIYVFGVGALGGTVLRGLDRGRSARPAITRSPEPPGP